MPEVDELPYEVVDETRLKWPVRCALVAVGLCLLAVFVTALWLDPYENGRPRRMETHRQLGLPPCSFYTMTGLPCPSCGFTTSFSLVAHADPVNAARANTVGMLLAAYCYLLIPWNLLSALRGRYLFVRSAETALIWSLTGFVTLMLVRWGIIVGLAWYG